MSKCIAAAGGSSRLNGVFFPYSFVIVRYEIPMATSLGIPRATRVSLTNVLEFMCFEEYINQPMHPDLTAWHGNGCFCIDILFLERASESSMPNLSSATGGSFAVTQRRFK